MLNISDEKKLKVEEYRDLLYGNYRVSQEYDKRKFISNNPKKSLSAAQINANQSSSVAQVGASHKYPKFSSLLDQKY